MIQITTEEYIKCAKMIHGDKYNYSCVNFKDFNTPIIISSSDYGTFEIKPKAHLTGDGFHKCKKLTVERFIIISNLIHKNKYDYSKV